MDLKSWVVNQFAISFQTPGGIALDPARQRLYVSETSLHRVQVIELASETASVLTGAAGKGYADGPLAGARFEGPEGLALGPDGRLYVAEFYGGRVRVIE